MRSSRIFDSIRIHYEIQKSMKKSNWKIFIDVYDTSQTDNVVCRKVRWKQGEVESKIFSYGLESDINLSFMYSWNADGLDCYFLIFGSPYKRVESKLIYRRGERDLLYLILETDEDSTLGSNIL